MNNPTEALPFLSSQERLDAYNLILQGCSHIWSKNQLQREKALAALNALVPLTKNDPYFLAHLTSYVMKKTKSKDLQVFTAYVNALSSADGSPFSPGSTYMKPNLRYVSAAAVQMMDPKLADRVLELATLKYSVPNYLSEARHFPSALRTALERYLQFREVNIEVMRGIKKAGLGNTVQSLYRGLHKAPTDEVAAILRWQQKDKKITFETSHFNFEGLSDLEVAQKIQSEKLPVLGVLGALPKMTPVIAVALLEQATGNQAVILRRTFEDAGVLNDPEVMKVYESKIREASTALDRAETLSKDASEKVKQALSSARAEVRQEATAGLGKIYMHIDFSSSMTGAIEFARERGAIIAECVNDPANNFRWGLFGSHGLELPLPQEFVKDAFQALLFGKVPNGSTDVFALYPNARQFGADVDVIVTDQGHNMGDLAGRIRDYHTKNPAAAKPRACVIVNFGGWDTTVKDAYEANGIPVSVLNPNTLTESALVVDAVKTAMLGPVAIIDDIMATDLLKLPEWYYTL